MEIVTIDCSSYTWNDLIFLLNNEYVNMDIIALGESFEIGMIPIYSMVVYDDNNLTILDGINKDVYSTVESLLVDRIIKEINYDLIIEDLNSDLLTSLRFYHSKFAITEVSSFSLPFFIYEIINFKEGFPEWLIEFKNLKLLNDSYEE